MPGMQPRRAGRCQRPGPGGFTGASPPPTCQAQASCRDGAVFDNLRSQLVRSTVVVAHFDALCCTIDRDTGGRTSRTPSGPQGQNWPSAGCGGWSA